MVTVDAGAGDELAGRRARADSSQPRGSRTARVAAELAAAVAERRAAAADRWLAARDRQRAAELLDSAYRDELTGALTRRAGRQQMHVEVERAKRTGVALSVVFVDVDGLKHINDQQGHLRGDELLAAVGAVLRTSLRSYDVIVRYGGDEFVCALPGVTSATARASIDRARRELAALIPGASLSTGHAELLAGDTLDELVHRADADLYRTRAVARAARRHDEAPGQLGPGDRQAWGGEPSVPCGGCGAAILLDTFVLSDRARMTRSATCRSCGRTTVIQLSSRGGGPPPAAREREDVGP